MSDLRIYVACLAAYNGGRLHGVHIDLEGKDKDDIWAEINAMLKRSPEPGAEEWAIHDYEGFGPLRLSEYESIDKIVAIAEKVEEHGQAFLGWMSNEERDVDDFDRFEDQYRGEWDSERAFAEEQVSELGFNNVPASISVPKGPYGVEAQELKVFDELYGYLDWDHITTEIVQHGTYYSVETPDYKVWMFDSEG